ncbi:hypothetical protein [Metabacillus malikii]|uniref:Polyhydroxyalkanoate synthesis regulator phasin n=1 Tax=Metabacillus malikii TaxID=1504265 RepID=A0ABT9ZKA2_9BACI|nr:hypothetical protein [Metabacillus malikii]MDQ0232723.1 polyhydroxyalkanoate synthesis regulator phasin [Metabacillus malikii]
MTRDRIDEFYRNIKRLAQGSEAQLNEQIQNLLNQEDVVQQIATESNQAASLLRNLQRYDDLVTTILRIPTKDDIANVAKLLIQLEDKIDRLEEELIDIRPALANNNDSDAYNQLIEEMEDMLNQAYKTVRKLAKGLKDNYGLNLNPAKRRRSALRKELASVLRDQALQNLQNLSNTNADTPIRQTTSVQEAPIEVLKRRLRNRG